MPSGSLTSASTKQTGTGFISCWLCSLLPTFAGSSGASLASISKLGGKHLARRCVQCSLTRYPTTGCLRRYSRPDSRSSLARSLPFPSTVTTVQFPGWRRGVNVWRQPSRRLKLLTSGRLSEPAYKNRREGQVLPKRVGIWTVNRSASCISLPS